MILLIYIERLKILKLNIKIENSVRWKMLLLVSKVVHFSNALTSIKSCTLILMCNKRCSIMPKKSAMCALS